MKNELKVVKPSVEALSGELIKIQKEIKTLKLIEDRLKADIFNLFSEKIKSAYAEKIEAFGQIVFKEPGLKITFNTPKKVTWDQGGLAVIHGEGGPVKVEYSVSETTFKELNDAGKAALMPYRTVEPGTVAVKVEVE